MAIPHFDPADVTRAVNDTLTVRRVFGDAYEREGTLVIPVATIWGAFKAAMFPRLRGSPMSSGASSSTRPAHPRGT